MARLVSAHQAVIFVKDSSLEASLLQSFEVQTSYCCTTRSKRSARIIWWLEDWAYMVRGQLDEGEEV